MPSRTLFLADVIRFGNGKSIKPGGKGRYIVYGSNGAIGRSDEFRYENGIIIGRVGAYCGSVTYCPQKFWASDNTLVAFPASPDFDTRFLYYLLRDARLNMYAGGAAQPLVTQTVLKQVEVLIPPLADQRRIASILSAYDELIGNCQQRIRITEQMARALYREWFVHFRFPGHKDITSIESSYGSIPRGWEQIPFESLLSSMTGGDWGSDKLNEVETCEVAVVRGTDLDEVAYGGRLRVPVRYIKHSSLKTRELRLGDVIVENSINAKCRCVGTSLVVDRHTLSRLGRDAIAASFCKVFRLHAPQLAPLVHLHLRHLREDKRMEYYQNVAANGIANFQAQKFAKEEHLVIPTGESVQFKFLQQVGAFSESISVLASKVYNLRRTCELLLPRLLAGKLNVDQPMEMLCE